MRDRLLAWWYTGPLGHFVAGAADWGALLARRCWARLRARLKGRARLRA